MSQPPTVAAAQFEPAVGDAEANHAEVERLTARAAAAGADVVAFPELCVTGYDLDAAREAAGPVPGPLTDPLVDVAAEYGVGVVAGVPERSGGDLYNVLAYVDGDGVRAAYRKRRPWGDERDVFAPGDDHATVEADAGRVGLLVCYDLNFPEESLAYARRECDVLVVGAAWRPAFRRDWRLLLRSRALDGTCYVVGSNHVGSQSGRRHGGGSLVAGPTGDVLAEADTEGSAVVTADVDSAALREARERNPVLEGRREGV